MTREEAKELLPIIQAFAEGKTVEFKNRYGNWVNCGNVLTPGFHEDFRIKPGPKYRPFKNADECWQEMLKHQPFGWIKIDGEYANITKLDCKDSSFYVDGLWHQICIHSMSENNIIFADGTPFGIKIEA